MDFSANTSSHPLRNRVNIIPEERTDKFGRLLGWISVGGLDIGEILLLGCDNLWEGTRENFGRCNFKKNPGTAHNFKVEKRLLEMVTDEYGVEIKPL